MRKTVKTIELKKNAENPRHISQDNFNKLVRSIIDFPEMLQARPLVVNKDLVVLGGNMRLEALIEAGVDEVTVEVVNWPEEKQREFIVKDNIAFGHWDWQTLADEWTNEPLPEWGLVVPEFEDEVDPSILDDEDDEDVDEMAGNVRSALLIYFEPEHYDEAKELWAKINKADHYAGQHVLNALRKAHEEVQ